MALLMKCYACCCRFFLCCCCWVAAVDLRRSLVATKRRLMLLPGRATCSRAADSVRVYKSSQRRAGRSSFSVNLGVGRAQPKRN